MESQSSAPVSTFRTNQYNSSTPSQASTLRARSQTTGSEISEAALELFQEELKASINQKRGLKVWKKITCPQHGRTDCYYITATSTKNEVMHWLRLKGFSDRASDVLKAISTEMLFKLKKDQLEKYLDDEGIKLYNHLQVQKNMSGYKTLTSQELNEILAQRRQKTESFDI